jgi:hypothetical protein
MDKIYRILFLNMYNFGKIFQQEIISKVGDFFVFYHIVFINMLDWISNIQYGSSFTQSKCRAMTCHCGSHVPPYKISLGGPEYLDTSNNNYMYNCN